ncbi:MAG: V-type ATP synthase subunit E [Oscillospiraceae bacterium]|nr:V-type ATP synthase subunit E [Oscillospiraceae bacterium]MBQ7143769.1 V-type ATP synthase subunit E [Oscillospiraceae bacterium]
MTGIEKIIARLESEANAELEAMRSQAKAENDAVLAEYREKANAEYESNIKSGKAACLLRGERLQSAAEMEAKKQLLSCKQELVNTVFDRAVEEISHLPKDQYVAFLVKQVLQAVQTGDEELIFNARDARKYGADVIWTANAKLGKKGNLKVSEENREIPGGVIVKRGNVEANCAADILVQLRRADLASQVAEILFA